MSDDRRREAERILRRDLEAYRNVADRDLPALEKTERILRSQAASEDPRPYRGYKEGLWMKFRRMVSARPVIAWAAGIAAVAVVLGIVPVTYERTTGQEVTMSVASLDGALAQKIAGEFREALGAKRVMVDENAGGTEIRALVPSRRGADVGRVAEAFAAALGKKGLDAKVSVLPQKERVSTSVYAMAMDRVVNLHVRVEGRSPAEIEADIRAQLEAAGIENAQVQVNRSGDETQVSIQGHDSNQQEGEREYRLNLNTAGADSLNPQLHRFEVERKPGMTDADVKAEVERQMREAGVEGQVTVENGQIRIEARKEVRR